MGARQSFTEISELDREILLRTDDQSLGQACQLNQNIRAICQDEYFWMSRIQYYFGPDLLQYKRQNETYQDQYRRLRQLKYTSDQLIDSTFSGYMDELILLSQSGVPLHNELLNAAAMTGRQNVIEWLLNHGLVLNDRVVVHAAREGHFNLVKWLVQIGAPLNVRTLQSALYSTPPEILDWMSEQSGRPLMRHTLMAASGGNIPALEWLVLHGYNLDEGHATSALANDRIETLDWLLHRLDILPPTYLFISTDRTIRGQVRLLDWLYNHEYELPEQESIEIVQDVIDHLEGRRDLTPEIDRALSGRDLPRHLINRINSMPFEAVPPPAKISWKFLGPLYTRDELDEILMDYRLTLKWLKAHGIGTMKE